jgi:hypothetical protein
MLNETCEDQEQMAEVISKAICAAATQFLGSHKINRSITLANGCYSPNFPLSKHIYHVLRQEEEETRKKGFTDLCYAFDCSGCISATSITQALLQVARAPETPSEGVLIVMCAGANEGGSTRGSLINSLTGNYIQQDGR